MAAKSTPSTKRPSSDKSSKRLSEKRLLDITDEAAASAQGPNANNQSTNNHRDSDSFGESLHQAGHDYWAKQGVQYRERFIAYISEEKSNILKDILAISNQHAAKSGKNTKYSSWWRIIIILATGFLAILNLLSALFSSGPGAGTVAATEAIELKWLTVIAAIFAAMLATIANMENFFNFSQRASNDRQARELYLNHYWNFRSQWTSYVVAFGHSPEACVNAIILHGQLILAEKEARQSVTDLASNSEATP